MNKSNADLFNKLSIMKIWQRKVTVTLKKTMDQRSVTLETWCDCGTKTEGSISLG